MVDRATWQAELDKLRVQEKAHTREREHVLFLAPLLILAAVSWV